MSSDHPTITVAPGAPISGLFILEANSTFPLSWDDPMISLGVTPTWGDHAAIYFDWGRTRASKWQSTVNFSERAPAAPGTYYIVAAFKNESDAAHLMSCTDSTAGPAVWNDGNDIADWSAATAEAAAANGTVQVSYRYPDGMHQVYVPAAAIKVIVQSTNPALNMTRALPQLAYGGGWSTMIYLSNVTADSTVVGVNFFGEDGQPLSTPQYGANLQVTLDGTATKMLDLTSSGPLVQGWVGLELPDGVIGYAVFRQSIPGFQDQEAVVPLSAITFRSALLVYDETYYNTGIAVVNPNSEDAVLTIQVRDEGGSVLGTHMRSLPARTKTAFALRTIPELNSVQGKRGFVVFNVPHGAVAVLGLRFNGQAFTSIPAFQ